MTKEQGTPTVMAGQKRQALLDREGTTDGWHFRPFSNCDLRYIVNNVVNFLYKPYTSTVCCCKFLSG